MESGQKSLTSPRVCHNSPAFPIRVSRTDTIELPSLTAVIQREEGWYVATCRELGVGSQGKTRKEAYSMLAEAVELWMEAASAKEIKRRLKLGGTVQPLQLAHA